MPIAFKEWAVTVRALAEGEQLVTLRKGGVQEPDKSFELDHTRFFLYPTFDHQRSDLVRESHQPEMRRALEEGARAAPGPPPRPPPGVTPPPPPGGRAWSGGGGGRLARRRPARLVADHGRRDRPARPG